MRCPDEDIRMSLSDFLFNILCCFLKYENHSFFEDTENVLSQQPDKENKHKRKQHQTKGGSKAEEIDEGINMNNII